MKSVLMLAYWFPPEGNAAVYRPLRFLRNLPSHGWEGRVVCGDGPFERYDPNLSEQIPEGAQIIRIGGRDLWQSLQAMRGEKLRRLAPEPTDLSHRPGEPGQAAGRSAIRSRIRSVVRRIECGWYHPDMQRPWI